MVVVAMMIDSFQFGRYREVRRGAGGRGGHLADNDLPEQDTFPVPVR
jgi:hypothetical protein